MTNAASEEVRTDDPADRLRTDPPDLKDYPVREYVSSMASELARMARWDGDEQLARALEGAADMASRHATPT